ncbi:hypothetical protein AVEN_192325-1, partial [Araneus ventricosus]
VKLKISGLGGDKRPIVVTPRANGLMPFHSVIDLQWNHVRDRAALANLSALGALGTMAPLSYSSVSPIDNTALIWDPRSSNPETKVLPTGHSNLFKKLDL